MKRLIIFFFIVLIPITAFCETISLSCSGRGINFDLNVDSSNGDMWGFAGYLAPGCIESKSDSKPPIFSINSTTAEMTCDNKIWSSTLRLSRNTGILIVSTYNIKKKSNEIEQYSCRKVTSKVF
jgi:hypothetical protein